MSPSPSLVLDPSAVWPSKAAAAARLACSVRTLERHIGEGRLKTRLQPVAGRKPLVLVDPAGIEAMLQDGRSPAVSPSAGGLFGDTRPQLSGSRSVVGALERLASAIAERPVPLPPRPWLTLDEAAEYSGLPRAWLLQQARSGSPVALDVSMGRRPSWRFSRSRLAAFRRS